MEKEQIFNAALAISTPDARQAFLDAACQGNAALRIEIDQLLEHDRAAGSFLDRPAAVTDATQFHPIGGEEPGDLIAGRYKLLEAIGEGGMGQVWVAQQIEPVHRRVAIKLIKPGMDSRQVLSRFETERQALALMDHPNIAKVLDGGVTDRGRPYFVMEYVKGVSLTEYCDQARLTVEQRLPLFVQVCQAVQHAHQKGIIHRDLKPSNILVCLYDGKPVPKVIDFGLAKAIQQPLTDRSLYTAHGAMLGTPLYMSPEQAELNNLDIDTRSDVYSLGVVLYELLTGTTPLDRQRIKQAAWQEIVRIIKEEDPVKPSTKLSGSGSLPTIATQRNLEPAQLCRTIRGDLDWIVMKSLEKERSRRYETANGLARDIERYLQDAPIEARPPSARYRFRKFARRNRVAIGTAIVIGAALVTGTAVSTWQAIRATRAEQAAKAALDDAEAQRLRAEEAYREARAAVERYLMIVSENQLLNVPGLQPLRKELLEAALEYYQKLANLTDAEGESMADLAEASLRVGTITSLIGSQEKALVAIDKAVEMYESLASAHSVSDAYDRRLLIAYENLGMVQVNLGQREQAAATYVKALALSERLAADHPSVPHYQASIASALWRLGGLQADFGRTAEAEGSLVRANRLLNDLSRAHPEQAHYQYPLADSHQRLADLQIRLGRRKEALSLKKQAVDLLEGLVRQNPDVAMYQRSLAESYDSLGNTHTNNRSPEAEAAYQRSYELREELARANPRVVAYQFDLAYSYLARGDRALVAGAFKRAEPDYQRAIEIAERLVQDNPAMTPLQMQFGEILGHVANFKCRRGQLAEAEALADRVVAIGERLVRENSSTIAYNVSLASAYGLRGTVLRMRGRPDDANRDLLAALECQDLAIARGMRTAGLLSLRGHVLANLHRWHEAAGAFAEASQFGEPGWQLTFSLALQQLAADDEQAYHATCKSLLDRFGDAPPDDTAAAICMTYAAAADHPADELQQVLKLAERIAAKNRLNPVYQVLLGAIQFRAGQREEAMSILKRYLPLHAAAEFALPHYTDAIRASRIVGETLLAVGYQQQGDTQRSAAQCKSLTALLRQYETMPPRYGEVVATWAVPLTIHLARRELARRDASPAETVGN